MARRGVRVEGQAGPEMARIQTGTKVTLTPPNCSSDQPLSVVEVKGGLETSRNDQSQVIMNKCEGPGRNMAQHGAGGEVDDIITYSARPAGL